MKKPRIRNASVVDDHGAPRDRAAEQFQFNHTTSCTRHHEHDLQHSAGLDWGLLEWRRTQRRESHWTSADDQEVCAGTGATDPGLPQPTG